MPGYRAPAVAAGVKDPIESSGVALAEWHGNIVIRYGGWLLVTILAVVTAYHFVHGRIKIVGGRSGRYVPRFTLVQRVVHWFAAILFVMLGVTGLALMLGRSWLLPLLGPEGFAAVGSAALHAHNLLGPLFLAATLALLIVFAKGNCYRRVDYAWVRRGGGLFGGHASSGTYNTGEKTWFWWSILMGIALSASGLALLFPAVLPDRFSAQLAILVHAAAAVLLIAFAIGHIYIGTIGMDGALEGMTSGAVDEAWAKQHHDLWWSDYKAQSTTDRGRAEVRAAEHGDQAAGEARR